MGSKAASEFETVARLRRDEAALDARLEEVRAAANQIVAGGNAEAARIAEEARRALLGELASLREASARKLEADLALAHHAAVRRREELEARAAGRRERAVELVIARVMP